MHLVRLSLEARLARCYLIISVAENAPGRSGTVLKSSLGFCTRSNLVLATYRSWFASPCVFCGTSFYGRNNLVSVGMK